MPGQKGLVALIMGSKSARGYPYPDLDQGCKSAGGEVQIRCDRPARSYDGSIVDHLASGKMYLKTEFSGMGVDVYMVGCSAVTALF